MGRVDDTIDEDRAAFLRRQHVFFVATAPSVEGRLNLSPKCLAGSFAVLEPTTVAYLDRYRRKKNATSIDGLPALDPW